MDKSKEFFHYRNAFKSDHLATADIEELQENNEGVAILTIIKIEYFENRKVAGRTKDKGLVAFFADKNGKKIKPMIVNSINSKIIASFIGSANVNEWDKLNLTIELYVDANVKMKGQVVGGIRVKTKQPQPKKTGKKTMPPTRWNAAKESVRNGTYTAKQLIDQYILTEEQINQLNSIKNG